jgi:uroporphyrinogen-III synthase
MSVALAGCRIAVPETRELDVLAQMLERHGANVLRCPLIAIRDVPDPAPVVAWLQRFTSNSPDDFILLTGEGLEPTGTSWKVRWFRKRQASLRQC